MFRRFIMIAALVILSFTTGCATVQPWQRSYLADPIMAFDDSRSQAFVREIVEIREASALGKSGKGGGCGCN